MTRVFRVFTGIDFYWLSGVLGISGISRVTIISRTTPVSLELKLGLGSLSEVLEKCSSQVSKNACTSLHFESSSIPLKSHYCFQRLEILSRITYCRNPVSVNFTTFELIKLRKVLSFLTFFINFLISILLGLGVFSSYFTWAL